MTKLEMLNVFLNDRLTAAAEEIFRAVKDTVLEYQSEIVCAKEENERLKRLLNIAVERLLLRPEPPSVHLPDDGQPCESEERGSVEPLPQIKEEPNFAILQTEDSQEARDSDERNASPVESLQSPQPPPSQTVCSRQSVSPPPTSSRAVKAESDGEDGGKPRDGSPSSTAAHLHCREARSDFCAGTEKSPGLQKRNQRAKSSLSSTGAQNARILQIKNIRSLKPPPPHPSHSSPNIQRWHSCKECGKGFNFACQLEVHMRWHTKEKPYSCTVCRKSFTTVSMLKRHHRIHTGEKPFRCLVCGKCFNQSAHLNTHFRLHAREGQPEPGAALHVNRFPQEEAGPRQAICKF